MSETRCFSFGMDEVCVVDWGAAGCASCSDGRGCSGATLAGLLNVPAALATALALRLVLSSSGSTKLSIIPSTLSAAKLDNRLPTDSLLLEELRCSLLGMLEEGREEEDGAVGRCKSVKKIFFS